MPEPMIGRDIRYSKRRSARLIPRDNPANTPVETVIFHQKFPHSNAKIHPQHKTARKIAAKSGRKGTIDVV
jgi:hypothetical protein